VTTETRIEFSEVLGRRVRLGSWEDQRISTYRKIREAIAQERWDDAAELTDFFLDEADIIFSFYRQWLNDLKGFLESNGVLPGDLSAIDAEIQAKLDLPDGTPWNPHRHKDRYTREHRQLLARLHREEADAAIAMLDQMKETWRQTHDRDVDHVYGLMSQVQDRLGSPGIAEMYQLLLIPLFAWRYEKFDIDKYPWDEGLETLMLVACEAMRGHLVGPERTGDFELIETDDRFILRFDPCGSGGRIIRGDWIEETPARMEAPYNWGVAKEEASWNHFTKDMGLYCAHCVVLMEEIPIDRFGYPVRVVDPPVYPDTNRDPEVRQKCQWQMFKDPTRVPEEYYERVGRKKPTVFGSSNFEAPEMPDASSVGFPGLG